MSFLTLNAPKLHYFEDQLQLALSTVRTLKNVVVPVINRLSQDVLTLIPTHFDPRDTLSTLNASHVCRYWRSALLSSPALWSTMDTARMTQSHLQLHLDRSRASPLDVNLAAGNPAHILQQVLDRTHQIRLLSFETMSWSQWKAVSQHFTASALPALVDLRISARTQADSAVPDSAIFSHASNLRHLSIRISGPPAPIWSQIAFPSLTSIRIRLGREFNPIMMVDPLLDVLQSSPLLEDVHLVFWTLMMERGVPHRRVSLPRLRNLSISCRPTPILILASITFPPSASVLAKAKVEEPFPHDLVLSLGQHLFPLISGSDELVFSHSMRFIQSTLHFKKDGETRFKLENSGNSHPLPLVESITFIATCPLDTIRRFVIEGRIRGVTNDQISRVLQNLRNVETLVLKGTINILPLLLSVTQDGQYPCPTLKTLTIDDDTATPHRKLVPVVKARSEAGFPLQRVILCAKYFEAVAGELRQFVEDVEYGEYTEFPL